LGDAIPDEIEYQNVIANSVENLGAVENKFEMTIDLGLNSALNVCD